MFESLTESLNAVFHKLRGRGKLTEKNIQDGLREIRMALLEADVNFKVAKDFIKDVTEKAIGSEVIKSITPGQQIVKIVHDSLIKLMGEGVPTIPAASDGPTVIMLAGLQGSGKTTTAGKLAGYLRRKGHNPLLVAADVQRPAAIEQLKVLGQQLDIPVYSEDNSRAVAICGHAVQQAGQDGRDMVILDTAGRLHIDAEMMAELREINAKVKPHEKYLVADAMTGQDAVNSAKEFNDQLELDGIILTKLDGDARGGAALSIKAVTGKPIKFVGVGEKLDRLEEFHPDRMASRILGMGDVVSLVEKAQETVDMEQAAAMQEKIRKNTLNLEDFLNQLQQVRKMGPLKDLMKMIPGLGGQFAEAELEGGEEEIGRIEAIIRSMTPEERESPEVIQSSRRRRIAAGSGVEPHEVNQLLKQFKQTKSMLKRFTSGQAPPGVPVGVPGAKGLSGIGRKKRRDKRRKRKK
ncbi:MAG: signal recognition particle protein [Planctomycetes bacterium]|nr:signal recognition particle protein [Planctomycetota bacterium]